MTKDNSYWRPANRADTGGARSPERPDDAEISGSAGVLGACSVCGCIAMARCIKCGERCCDSVCLDAHRQTDHARIQPVIHIHRCKRCNVPLTGEKAGNRDYCSEGCKTLAALVRTRRKRTAA